MAGTPKYQEIIDYIRKQVENDVYPEGAQLPTEQFLAEKFDASRPTVVKAMDKLRDMGVVYRVQGRGTFLCKRASSLGNKSNSNTISVILPFAQYRDEARLDEMNILKGIVKRLSQHGFFTIIHYCKDNGLDFIETIKSVKTSQSIGMIAYVAKNLMECSEIYDLFMEKYPFVLIDQSIVGADFPCVRSDNVKGGTLAAEHLIDCGYDAIYFMSDVNLSYNESVRDRYFGFCQVVKRTTKNIFFGYLFFEEEDTITSVENSISQLLLKHKDEKIGIFCNGDYFASKIYRACYNLKVDIPKKIGIVGFDGLGLVMPDNSKLTTITQNFYEIGKMASDTILKIIDNEPIATETMKADVKLTLGDSTMVF